VTNITDHLGIFAVIPALSQSLPSVTDRPLVRIFSESNKSKFQQKLYETDWSHKVYSIDDVDKSVYR